MNPLQTSISAKTPARTAKGRFAAVLTAFAVLVSAVAAQGESDAGRWERPVRKCWERKAQEPLKIAFASDNERELYLTSPDSSLEKSNAGTGDVLWRNELGGRLLGFGLLSPERGVVIIEIEGAGFGLRRVARYFDPSTGLTLKQTSLLSGAGEKQDLVLSGSSTALLIDGQRVAVTRDIPSHPDIVRISAPSVSTLLAIQDGTVLRVFAADGRSLGVLNSRTGWSAFAFGPEGTVFGGDKAGGVWAYRIEDGKALWKVRTGGRITSLESGKDGLLVSSFDNYLYLFEPRNGNLVWKRRLQNRISIAPVRASGVLAVTTIGESFIEIISEESGKTLNRVQLTDGSEAADWMRMAGGLLIVGTSGRVTAFAPGECPAGK